MHMTQPIGELTDRMREIFGLVVEAYLERGHPVGSKALTGSISLSPASIRGVMQELEERGLLTHPHTSAGRIPTERGLRLFVDGIMQTAAPDPRERMEIERQIVRDQPIEDALAAASAALSGLSSCAGIVLAPKQQLRLRQFNVVPLGSSRARAVLVGRGQANLIDAAAAEDLERVRMLLDELEEAQEIARLLEGARDAPGCRIFIGSENRMFALSGSSVIAAPYRGSQGQVVGVVGVIGPTRLNYARVVPMVDFTAKALTRLMA